MTAAGSDGQQEREAAFSIWLAVSVRTVRGALGLSLRDLADRSGVSANSLSRLERGLPISGLNTDRLVAWLHREQPNAMRAVWACRMAEPTWTAEQAPS